MLSSLTPQRRFQLILVAVVVAIVGLGYALIISPRMSQPGEINAQADQQTSANDKARSDLAVVRDKTAHIADEQAKAAKVGVKFPSSADEAVLLNQVNTAADVAGISHGAITNITLSPPTLVTATVNGAVTLPTEGEASSTESGAPVAPVAAPGERIASMDITFSVTADQAHFQAFLKALENGPRAFLVKMVNFSAGGEGAAGTAGIQGSMFVVPEPAVAAVPGAKVPVPAK